MVARKSKRSAKRGSTKPSDQPSAKPSGDKPKREGIPQPHGGVLIPGAGGGPQPGSGRPRSAIRKELLDGFGARVKFYNDVIDGELVTRYEVSLGSVLPHVKCAVEGCPGKVVPKDPADLALVKFSAKASANVADRLKAMEAQGKFSLGVIKGIMVDEVEENVKESLGIIRELTTPEQYDAIAQRMRAVWT